MRSFLRDFFGFFGDLVAGAFKPADPDERAARLLLPGQDATLEVTRRGVAIHVSGDEARYLAQAAIRVPPGAVLTTSDDAYPVILAERGLRIRGPRPDVVFDTPALDHALRRLLQHFQRVDVECGGRQVAIAVRGGKMGRAILESLLDAVALLARWDDGFAAALASLPGATPQTSGDLDPGVVIAPGDVRVGLTRDAVLVAVRDLPANHGIAADKLDPATHARVARAGDGELMIDDTSIRFTWRGLERDAERIQAAIDALRSVRDAAGPYR